MSRITGRSAPLDGDAVRRFFDARAPRARSAHPLTSVLYQDGDPDLAARRDRHEKSVALPLLQVAPGTSVLDVGCGIGRWAGPVLAAGGDYCGADYSGALLEAAREAHPGGRARFVQAAAQDLDPVALGRPDGFDRLVVAGVLLYLDDAALATALPALLRCCAARCRIWLREPFAVTERLTLQAEWSAELAAEYSAVYRTRDEVVAGLEQTFLSAGFVLRDEGELYPDALNNRAETRQRYLLLERP